MKKVFKSALLLMAACVIPLSFTSCSDDGNGNDDGSEYSDKSYGNAAIDACTELRSALRAANNVISNSSLDDSQKAYLDSVINNAVDNVILPTYTDLASAVVELQSALGDLSASQITQTNINDACTAFKKARKLWEKSEAFLGGEASDHDIDPHIDSWPLNRDLLHSMFKNGMTDEITEEASVLGFHALEFILFRNGEPRKVSEYSQKDTYKGFTDIEGTQELAYAQSVAKDLLNHVYALEVGWSDSPVSAHLAAVKSANIGYQTDKGQSYSYNMKNYGTNNSTFSGLTDAISQLLSDEEGSAWAIANEVGTAKIANPFSAGDISYVESPYSYNSITDFQDNIRSIENIWYGGTNGSSSTASCSFHQFFKDNAATTGNTVETAIQNAIEKIGAMPYPFVKYVSTVWNLEFDETPVQSEE